MQTRVCGRNIRVQPSFNYLFGFASHRNSDQTSLSSPVDASISGLSVGARELAQRQTATDPISVTINFTACASKAKLATSKTIAFTIASHLREINQSSNHIGIDADLPLEDLPIVYGRRTPNRRTVAGNCVDAANIA